MDFTLFRPISIIAPRQCTYQQCQMPSIIALVAFKPDACDSPTKSYITLCVEHAPTVVKQMEIEGIVFRLIVDNKVIHCKDLCERLNCFNESARIVRVAGTHLAPIVIRACEDCAFRIKAEYDAKPGYEVWVINK